MKKMRLKVISNPPTSILWNCHRASWPLA